MNPTAGSLALLRCALAALGVGLLLAACGGGGEASGTTGPTPATPVAPTPSTWEQAAWDSPAATWN